MHRLCRTRDRDRGKERDRDRHKDRHKEKKRRRSRSRDRRSNSREEDQHQDALPSHVTAALTDTDKVSLVSRDSSSPSFTSKKLLTEA